MAINKVMFCLVLGFAAGGPSVPKDPPVAPTEGFFLDDWKPKKFDIPNYQDAVASTGSTDVTVRVDTRNIITRIPPADFGHNANPWMGSMVTQPAFMQHLTDLRPHVIRWPAGSGSDGYWWDRPPGDPPADAPRTVLDKNGNKIAAHYFYGRPPGRRSGSLDDYYEARRQTGNEGIITVNYAYARYGTGPNPVETAAHYAADWVRYDRGRTKYASTFSSGELNVTLVNIGPQARVVRVVGKGWKAGKRYYWFTMQGGDDNREFSRKVFVNGQGPPGAAGGPDNYATIPAWSAP
ncbi:MAG TPA: hypothetical protein VGR89_15850, partial [Puia sp.]|nr:hypothetical protein [Puia sp.]